jgi:hypothetical protein
MLVSNPPNLTIQIGFNMGTVPNLAYPGQTAYPWHGVTVQVGIFKGPPTTCHCTSMPLVHSSHSRFPGEESLHIQCHGMYTQLNLLNSLISPMSGHGKGGKGLGKGGPSVTARFFVTTSKVSFTSTIVVVTHVQPRHRKTRYSSSWWCQACFWSYLWGDPWCLEENVSCSDVCLILVLSSNIITGHSWLSHTPSTQSRKLPHLSMSSTHWNDQGIRFTGKSFIFSLRPITHLFHTVSVHDLVSISTFLLYWCTLL